ncbi:MAG: hypothetical protein ACXABO_07175 [Promethearchaeota archaeon]|jgi:hypothetical protein
MTAQIPDEFVLNGEDFSLVGLNGQDLFTPEDFGIIPYSGSTACWRGFVMKYLFINDQLFLEEMRVNAKNPPEINGVKPEPGEHSLKYSYKNLNLKTNFTGKILLAKDFIQSMYVHMGFQRPIAFKTVVEIKVEEGKVISLKDFSKQMEDQRNANPYKGAQPQSNSQKDIENWVKEKFSLDYD